MPPQGTMSLLEHLIFFRAAAQLHRPSSVIACNSKESGNTCHSEKEFGAAGAQQAANGVFVFDAASVTFVNATSMILSGLPNSTAYVQYPPRVNAGTFAKVHLC